MKSVRFFSLHKQFRLFEKKRLKEFIIGIFQQEGHELESVQYIFCTDEFLLKINKSFLSHDFYTDIISFELSPHGKPIEAEVYISVDRVRENAELLGESFNRELHRVIFHGALHLCGYKDKLKKEKQIMRKKEERYLEAYLITK